MDCLLRQGRHVWKCEKIYMEKATDGIHHDASMSRYWDTKRRS